MTTTKPKERQFHVVPVPAIFTRGRWECRDYKESNPNDSQILDFTTEKQHNNSVSAANLAGANADSSAVTNLPTASSVQLGGGGAVVPPGSVNCHFIIGGGGTSTGNVSQASVLHPLDFPSPSTSSAPPPIHSVSMPNANAMASSTTGAADGTSGIASVVAIDNKIEQAMDLVKTHLTFAVREEVEILRTTIAELEAKVANLEGENQILRQYAPPEVIANLPRLVQNVVHQHKSSTQSQQFHHVHAEHQKLSTASEPPHSLPQQ